MDEYTDNSDEKSQGIGIGIGIGIAIGMMLGSMLFKDKYEGQTAHEWFDEYDWVISCICFPHFKKQYNNGKKKSGCCDSIFLYTGYEQFCFFAD